jgi:dolichol-phosphate mannosyltransferase
MINVGRLRRLLSRGAGWFARVALGVDERTVSSFFRVYRAALLRSGIHRYGDSLIRESGFACKAELLGKLRALGARVEEVPVDVDGARRIGESKMPVLKTMLGYWRLLARQRLGLERASA